MGIMTGVLSDFRKNGIDSLGGRIIFVPRGPDGTSDGYLMVTRALIVYPTIGGDFSTNLIDPENTNRGEGFDVFVEWLNGENIPVGRDYFGILYPPPGGGRVTDYLQAGAHGSGGSSGSAEQRWWIEPTPPDPWPNGVVWVNTTTWDLIRKVA